jgi:hypothetical protein
MVQGKAQRQAESREAAYLQGRAGELEQDKARLEQEAHALRAARQVWMGGD